MWSGQSFSNVSPDFRLAYIFDMPLETAGEDSGLQNVAAELFESGFSCILSTGMSKLLGAFHH